MAAWQTQVTTGSARHGKAAGWRGGNADAAGLPTADHRRMDRKLTLSLVRCRECDSRLLQAVDVVGPIDGSCVVARFCPECGRRDLVVAEGFAVRVWQRRDERIVTWLGTVADQIASAAEIAADVGG